MILKLVDRFKEHTPFNNIKYTSKDTYNVANFNS